MRPAAVTTQGATKVLILDGHSKAAAASILALPRSATLHVAATAEDAIGFTSRRVARKLQQPHTPAALRAWLEELDAAEHYQLVIPSTEASLLAVKAQDLAPDLRTRCVLAPEAALDIALDKRGTLELANRLDVCIPVGGLVTSWQDAIEPTTWPTVVKPVHSKVATPTETMSLQPRICADAKAWRQALGDFLPWSPVLVQEYFRGHGVGVEVLFEQGQPRWLFAHRRIHELPVTGGASSYRRSIPVPPVLQHATLDLLGALDWHGVAMVEFKLADNGDYRLMEINPRLWGSLPLAIAAGVNFPLGLLRLATGEPVGNQPRYRRMYARDVVKDAHWFEDSLRERHNPLRVSPLRIRDFPGLLRPLIGLESWDLFRWREPEMWRASLQPALAGLRARRQRKAAARQSRRNWQRLLPAWSNGQIRNVLVLCYGNICRSPVVAKLLQRTLPGINVESSGFHPRAQRPSPATWSTMVAESLDVDLHDHRSQTIDAHGIARADLILVMDSANWRTLSRHFPDALPKAVLLGVAAESEDGIEIRDPYDEDVIGMRLIAAQLGRACTSLATQRQRADDTTLQEKSA